MKERIKQDLDKIWSKYLIEEGDSEDAVIAKFSAALKEQRDYFAV